MSSTISIFPVSHQSFQDRCIYFKDGMAQTFERGALKENVFYRQMRPYLKGKLDADCQKLCHLRLGEVTRKNASLPRTLQLASNVKSRQLTEWVCRKIGSAEYQTRVVAAEKIMDAFLKNATFLDLKYLNLSDLPEFLKELTELTEIHLTGNLLQRNTLDLISKLPKIKNIKNLERLIVQQDGVFLNPTKFFETVKDEDLKLPNRDWYTNRRHIMSERLASVITTDKLYKNISEFKWGKDNINCLTTFEKIIVSVTPPLIYLGLISTLICLLPTLAIETLTLLSGLIILVTAIPFGIASYAIAAACFCVYDFLIERFNKLSRSFAAFGVSHGIGNGASVQKIIEVGIKACQNLEKHNPDPFLKSFKDALKDSFWDVFSDRGFHKIQNNELVMLSTGYTASDTSGGHHICIVFYKNHMAICNRGLGFRDHPIEIYEIDRSKITPVLLENLKGLSQISRQKKAHGGEFQQYYLYSALVQAITIKKVVLPSSLNIKPQKVGNCSLASFKCAFVAARFLMQDKKTDEAANEARHLKRQFSYHLRAYTLKKAQKPVHNIYLRLRGQRHLCSLAEKKMRSYRERKLPTMVPRP